MSFDRALALVLRHEGGLSDDPNDPGGITNHGISIRFAGSIGLDLDGDGKTTKADIRAMTPEYAAEIYKMHFWDKYWCSDLPPRIAIALFDGVVNQGPVVVRFLQRAAGVRPDGFIGPVTLRAVREAEWYGLLRRFMSHRAMHYANLKNVNLYGRGWYARLLDVFHVAASTA